MACKSKSQLILLTAGLLAGGCSTYTPIEPMAAVRSVYSEQLGDERAATMAIPFEIDEVIRSDVRGLVSPAVGEQARTEQILSYIFDRLELTYAVHPTRDAVGTYMSREGNCLSFVNLFVGVAREFRLNPFYVEVEDYQKWNYRDGVVISQGHIVAGMYVNGDLSTFDFIPYQPKSYRDFEPIDDLTATAHHYNNLGAEALMDGKVEAAQDYLELAAALAPDFDKALNNLGVTYLHQGLEEEAVAIYEQGLEIDPQNVPLLSNLARAFQQIGRWDEAMGLLETIEGLGQTSAYFYVYRGELALSQGDQAAALEYMKRGLRTDSEIPEVHVGLLKVYLAMGDIKAVRHHLQRALTLDATHREARTFAAMLTQGSEIPSSDESVRIEDSRP